MADKDLETEKLELSLFRRKKKSDPVSGSASESVSESASESEPAPTSTSEPEPAPAPAAESRPKPGRRKATKGSPAAPAARQELPPTTQPTTQPTGQATATRVDNEPVRAAESEAAEPTEESAGRRVDVALPSLAPPIAALAVGAVVGLAAVALTFASLKGCELVTGTDSCGGPGLLVLLAVVVLMILGGATALRQLDVPDAGGLSFLGVAMFVAVCLVVLLPSLLEPWMVVVAPVLCALTYLMAQWIVSRFDEEILNEEGPEPHDVR